MRVMENTMSAGDWKNLYAAAVEGDLAVVRYHISAGVNPDYQHPEIMCTPLVASLIQGHSDIAHYLLAQGADPHLRSEFDGLTPLQAARKHGRTEFVELLLERGAREPRQPFWWRWLPI
jgi:ankyrin repeat protein